MQGNVLTGCLDLKLCLKKILLEGSLTCFAKELTQAEYFQRSRGIMLFSQYIVRSMISVGYEGLAKHVRSSVRGGVQEAGYS